MLASKQYRKHIGYCGECEAITVWAVHKGRVDGKRVLIADCTECYRRLTQNGTSTH